MRPVSCSSVRYYGGFELNRVLPEDDSEPTKTNNSCGPTTSNLMHVSLLRSTCLERI